MAHDLPVRLGLPLSWLPLQARARQSLGLPPSADRVRAQIASCAIRDPYGFVAGLRVPWPMGRPAVPPVGAGTPSGSASRSRCLVAPTSAVRGGADGLAGHSVGRLLAVSRHSRPPQ